MSLIQWSPAMSVGLSDIDEQHMGLLHFIDGLHAAMQAGKSRALLDRALRRLKDYVSNHFSHEEELMLRMHFPDRANHEALHRQFVIKVAELEMNMEKGLAPATTMNMCRFLSEWYVDHIGKVDACYAEFIRKRQAA